MTSSSKAIVACALLILLGIGMLSFRSTVREEQDRGYVTHTHLVIEKIQAILIAATQAETGERGYILTGEEKYRDHCQSGLNQTHGNIEELRRLTADDPSQQDAIKRLEPIVDARLAGLVERIEIRRRNGFRAGVESMGKGNNGEELMDEIQERIGEMRRTEEQRLSVQLRRAEASARRTKGAIVIGTVLAILILFMAGYVIRREGERREQNLKQVNEHLVHRTSELENRTAELLTSNSELEGRTAELLASNSELEGRTAELLASNGKLESRTAELLASNNKLGSRTAELSASNRELEGRTAELLASNGKLESRTAELSASNNELESRTAELLASNRELEGRTAELLASNRELEGRTAELLASNGKLESRTAELSASNSELESRTAELLASNRELESRTAELLASNNKLESRTGELLASNGKLETRTAELSASNGELESRTAELSASNSELESRTAELSEANIELESFAYSVAHDLRAPLRHIAGYSNVLSQDYGHRLDVQGQRYLAKIVDGAQKMGHLVDDLLSLSKIGLQELSLEDTALDKLLRQVVEDLAPESSAREVEWQIGDLPSAECDPGLMKQVFVNLLSNAVKYTGKRERAVIEVGQTMRNGERVIFVRDNGVGFEMQYAGKLFGVFQRLHKAGDFEGTGVGLAIVQRIIRKHGGRIWAEAEIDKGATFFFTLGSPENNPAHSPELAIRNEVMHAEQS